MLPRCSSSSGAGKLREPVANGSCCTLLKRSGVRCTTAARRAPSPRRRAFSVSGFAKNEMRHAAVRVSFRSLLLQRYQWDTYWGPKKEFFLIRDIDGPAMRAASVESCQFVVLRSPRGRLGSILDMGNRLSRMRGRFRRWPTLSARHRARAQVPQVFDPELSGELQVRAHAA